MYLDDLEAGHTSTRVLQTPRLAGRVLKSTIIKQH